MPPVIDRVVGRDVAFGDPYPAASRAFHDAGFPAITGTKIAEAAGQSVKQSSVNSWIIRVPTPMPALPTSPMK
nr:hypothetical protein [Brevibacterium sp. VCM10]